MFDMYILTILDSNLENLNCPRNQHLKNHGFRTIINLKRIVSEYQKNHHL